MAGNRAFPAFFENFAKNLFTFMQYCVKIKISTRDGRIEIPNGKDYDHETRKIQAHSR